MTVWVGPVVHPALHCPSTMLIRGEPCFGGTCGSFCGSAGLFPSYALSIHSCCTGDLEAAQSLYCLELPPWITWSGNSNLAQRIAAASRKLQAFWLFLCCKGWLARAFYLFIYLCAYVFICCENEKKIFDSSSHHASYAVGPTIPQHSSIPSITVSKTDQNLFKSPYWINPIPSPS